MAVDESWRQLLHRRLGEVIGTEAAGALMDHLPQTAWDEVATREHVSRECELTRRELRTEFRERLSGLRTETRTEMADLRTDMGDLRTELRTEMADLRTELRMEMADLRTELRTGLGGVESLVHREVASLRQDMTRQTRTYVFTVMATVVSSFGAFAALVH